MWLFLASLVSQLVARVPIRVWLAFAGLATLLGTFAYHRHVVRTVETRAFAAGRASVQRDAKAQLPVQRREVERATTQTETSARSVTRAVTRLDPLLDRAIELATPPVVRDSMPVSVDTLEPVRDTIKQALETCRDLRNACEQLRADIVVERAARDTLQQQTAIVVTAYQDTTKALKRRPTRKAAILGGIAAAVVGFLVGSR